MTLSSEGQRILSDTHEVVFDTVSTLKTITQSLQELKHDVDALGDFFTAEAVDKISKYLVAFDSFKEQSSKLKDIQAIVDYYQIQNIF